MAIFVMYPPYAKNKKAGSMIKPLNNMHYSKVYRFNRIKFSLNSFAKCFCA